MTLKTGKQYKESIQQMRPNVYKFGKLIADVTTDPNTKFQIDFISQCYDRAFDSEYAILFTTTSHLTGDPVHRWNSLMQTAEDVMNNARMKRAQYHICGACPAATCVGWSALNALWSVTYECDGAYGTTYHKRLMRYWNYMQDNALALSGAITDAKGNRTQKASEQKYINANIHVEEIQEHGIIVSGYKVQIAGVSSANEIIVVPGTGYKDADKKFAVAFAVPRDAQGITVIETRRPSDTRETEEGWDVPHSGNGTEAFILFEHVFIPHERVFMCQEYPYAGRFIEVFAAYYRSAIGGCGAGQGDIIMGTALNMARANGIPEKVFREKLLRISINNETMFGVGLGAIVMGNQHPSGAWIPDSLLAHVNKTLMATLPYLTKQSAFDIAGGIGETGCFPSYKDFQSPQYGTRLKEAMTAGWSGEDRAKMARLLEWVTYGGACTAFIHGGGSPDGAKLTIHSCTKWEERARDACRIAHVADIK
jgi:4-hydroxybutyryl-CoA dehydratase/vinylacetyl-CoA-Delta-isomerase